jgi:hypothetical protein
VEFGRGRRLYALSQGDFPAGSPPATPALPDTGALVEVNGDGTFTVITDGLDRPTSLEFIGNTAYVVTLTGEIWKIEGVSCPPYGHRTNRYLNNHLEQDHRGIKNRPSNMRARVPAPDRFSLLQKPST